MWCVQHLTVSSYTHVVLFGPTQSNTCSSRDSICMMKVLQKGQMSGGKITHNLREIFTEVVALVTPFIHELLHPLHPVCGLNTPPIDAHINNASKWLCTHYVCISSRRKCFSGSNTELYFKVFILVERKRQYLKSYMCRSLHTFNSIQWKHLPIYPAWACLIWTFHARR